MGLVAPVEKLFLNNANATAALERARIPEQASSFITFHSDRHSKKLWEQSAATRLISSDEPGEIATVEANLHSLTRDFGACIAIPQLYGKHFLERYPQALEDLWKFDNDLFPLLMIGLPTWTPLKIVREGLAARTRIIAEIEALYRRIDQYRHGKPIDDDIDMSDISDVALERSAVYERNHWSFSEQGPGDFSNFWGQNANTHPVLAWVLTYIYSTDGLLDRLREEIAPYVGTSPTTPREIVSFDMAGLSQCQLFKACIFETYRLVNEPTSIRYVVRPMVVKDGDLTHELQPGTFVSAPHSVMNRDASMYPDPETFLPERFLEPDAESGKPVARYGKLKPWGSGVSMCKGRTFAEKEILSVGAAIISLWDIKPASGTWELPAMLPGTGVKKPVSDIRVLITRRRS
jgi:cytochrome P450